jgi:ABC-2 type transport system ATP-binding protein
MVPTPSLIDDRRVIEVEHLSKRYGEKLAVDDVTFTVRPGIVTGFLGPNGAGKSTTMRMMVGLDAPSAGSAKVGGRDYRSLEAPLHEVGALLEARAIHPGRSAYHHLLAMAETHGMPRGRVDEVLELVGLSDVARQRVGSFSLGMTQRLGVASALLGDPATVILDEPVNGLDPQGVLWIRTLLKGLAAEGRTVFVSSHLMSETALTADHVVVVGRGRLVADMSVADIVAQASQDAPVLVRTPDAAALRDALAADGVAVASREPGLLEARGVLSARIGELAARDGLVLYELTPQKASLEDAFMRLTGEFVDFRAAA